MKKIVTFGEIMLRLAPNGYNRFFQDDQLQATFGGGEANVAVSLANYGMRAAFVTRLPSHAIGQGAVNALRALGVDTSHIVRGGDRVGIYYLEKGASQRAACASMTGPTLPFSRQRRRILTGTAFLRTRFGFTLPALHPRWEEIWWKSVSRPARRPRQKELKSPAI